jgi:hypothetical protein
MNNEHNTKLYKQNMYIELSVQVMCVDEQSKIGTKELTGLLNLVYERKYI